jgi:hypothetical protein
MVRFMTLVLILVGSPMIAGAQASNEPRAVTKTSRAQAEHALDAYFAGMHSHDFSHVPFTHDVVFRGSCIWNPFTGIRPFARSLSQEQKELEACGLSGALSMATAPARITSTTSREGPRSQWWRASDS